jgi:hypothetical protein
LYNFAKFHAVAKVDIPSMERHQSVKVLIHSARLGALTRADIETLFAKV